MNFPEKIRIKRIEDYHTHYTGKYDNGEQFFGYGTFVFTEMPIPKDWQKYRREYAVLYLFDKEGNFLKAKNEFAGTTDSVKFDTEEKVEELVSELGEIEYCDVELKPFNIVIDGYIFGLILNEESKLIELYPSKTIAFGEPWDGEYYT